MGSAAVIEPEVLQILPEPDGTLIVVDSSGDSRIQWDRSNPDQVAAARSRFDELRKKGYLAYTVDASGRQGTVIDQFDPDAGRIIMNPRMVGG